jgi:uncharacterized membrane protein YcaP (DUF421 family)
MYERIFYAIVRGAITYFFALLLTRLMGRKLTSQMTFFDFVVGVSMGSLAANLAMGSDNTSTTAATALSTMAALAVITGFIHIKSFKARKIINSEPVTLIDSGNIVEGNMKRIRLTIGELTMKLREKNVFNLADVEFAIMETDGQLSVLPKPDKVPLTPSHMNIQASSNGLMRDVVIDGKLMEENLNSADLDMQWLQSQLNMQGIGDVSELFYAGLDANKKLYVSKRNAGNTEGHGKYGIA